jgi:hypothetical protein
VIEPKEGVVTDAVVVVDVPVVAGVETVFRDQSGGRLPEEQELLADGLLKAAEVVADGLEIIPKNRCVAGEAPTTAKSG